MDEMDTHRHLRHRNLQWTAWMARARRGDETAFTRLVTEVTPELDRYFRRRGVDAEDAAELGQTTLMRIHAARERYDAGFPFGCWMFAIARNALTDHFRALRRAPVLPEAIDEGAEDCAYCRVLSREAVDRLTPDQLSAIMRVHVEGLSLQEAARREGITVGALKVRVHRARQKLSEALVLG